MTLNEEGKNRIGMCVLFALWPELSTAAVGAAAVAIREATDLYEVNDTRYGDAIFCNAICLYVYSMIHILHLTL